MNIMLTLRQVCHIFQARQESEGCEVCDVALPPGEFICDDGACQMQALEAQAMLGPYTLGPSVNRRQTVLRLTAALPAEPGSDSYAAHSAWAF